MMTCVYPLFHASALDAYYGRDIKTANHYTFERLLIADRAIPDPADEGRPNERDVEDFFEEIRNIDPVPAQLPGADINLPTSMFATLAMYYGVTAVDRLYEHL